MRGMSCGLVRTVSCYIPDYLNAEYPGDCGWGGAELGLVADPKIFECMRKTEVLDNR